ncbi:MAG: biotin--[acetyl-CoA-carboxylase] ligase, partial [Lachnospiraceae bacterium]
GKGRRGRSWETPAGSAVAMSLILRPDIWPERASMLTLVMGLAVASACRDCYGVQTKIKWPNDIVINGRKLCGILTEMSSEIDYIRYIVIGVGINTKVEHFPKELRETAVSLHEILGRTPQRALLIASCLKWFEKYYAVFLQTQDLSQLREEYNDMLAGLGDPVRVLEPSGEYTGRSEGINEKGELLVRRDDGTLETVYAGEVSVRGIYGYI